LQNKWNEICMKQLASGKHTKNDCFPRTLKFEMTPILFKEFQAGSIASGLNNRSM
jgi:hypothetical protein